MIEQIDVELLFNDESEPVVFVSDDGSLSWAFENVVMADWKDNEGQVEAAIKLTKRDPTDTIVLLFDGSDTMIYALLGEAIKS